MIKFTFLGFQVEMSWGVLFIVVGFISIVICVLLKHIGVE